MTELDPTLADQAILDADHSQRGWRRRAVHTARGDALAEIPRVGTFQAQVPIEAFHHIQRHAVTHGGDQAKWVHHAIVTTYLLEGGDADIAAAALVMERTHRARDVPRDQYGQDRSRQGRRR